MLKQKKPGKTEHASWDFCFSADQVAKLNVHKKGNPPGKPVLSEANAARLKRRSVLMLSSKIYRTCQLLNSIH